MGKFIILSLLVALSAPAAIAQEAPLRVGIIGLDTSHVTAFTALLNDPSNPNHVPGARVVAAYKGGSPDIESSATRIDKFTTELQTKWNVELVGSIEELCRKVDAVLLAGGGFRHGQHLAFDPKNNKPLANLFVTMLQRMGIEADKFASSTGTMTGVEV
ncbi:MAG: hypothetical protein EBZ36_02455 [Acidobacteria bacterium]|nr:hypothetical protein [Acidobacteriota bacterium]